MSDSEKDVFYKNRGLDMHQRMQFRRETEGPITEEVQASFSHDGGDFVWIDEMGLIMLIYKNQRIGLMLQRL